MYLKTLTMRGFKSFASATTLALEPGITCVVGPNGSGKSNVVDALAWVMGEQGARNLRGGKMDDVIFAGTSKRQALGRAEVSLTIDNSDGQIPIDYTEVTISRTLFRTGGSEYAVNGESARLLDIQELLNDSGLGKEMHVIVGQGRLDQILHADPLERRGFIEEAAGVLKHRRRKDKALRKLTGLQANLDRLMDLRQELARQLGPLGRQAKAASRAAGVQATLRDTSARLLADDIVRLQSQLETDATGSAQQERRQELELTLAGSREEIAQHEADLQAHSAVLERLTDTARHAAAAAGRARALAQRAGDRVTYLRSQKLQSTGRDAPEAILARAARTEEELKEAAASKEAREAILAELTAQRTQQDEVLRECEAHLEQQRAQITAHLRERSKLTGSREIAAKALADAQSELARLDHRDQALGPELEQAAQRLVDAQSAAAALETGETALDAAHEAALEAQQNATAQLGEVETQIASLTAELGQLTARSEALDMSTRLAADTQDLLAAGLHGVHGPVGELLSVTEGWEQAIAALLGDVTSSILVDSVDAALAVLGEMGAARDIDLLVEEGLTNDGASSAKNSTHTSTSTTVSTPPTPEALAASSLVTAQNSALAQHLDLLLHDVWACDSLAQAQAGISADPTATFVVKTGEVIRPQRITRTRSAEGARIAARAALAQTQDAAGQRQQELDALNRQRVTAATSVEDANAQVAQTLAALHDSDAQIMAAGQEVARAADHVSRLTMERDTLDTRTASLKATEEQAAQALTDAEGLLRDNDEGSDAAPDTTQRDEARAALTALGEQVLEARIGVRAATDREAGLRERVHSLKRQAREETLAREQAQAAHTQRIRRADGLEGLARVAAQLTDTLAAAESNVDERLARFREERAGKGSTLKQLRQTTAAQAAELNELTTAEHEARLARERFIIQLEELARRAETEVGLSVTNLVEQFGPHLPVPLDDGEETAYVRAEVEKRRAKAEKDLKGIGRVNPLALEEFTALQERHDFLEKQITDIEEGRRDLMGLVKEVDKHVEEVFREAFADTQREFQRIFTRLFPGGEGALTLTDPDDMLASGVDVHARPAGKKVKRLSLLSGGERSLVAIAMLVAIFKARPSPFYVMDEVEAALDDLNLSRLLTVFQELQESSQLIVITHQKRTMEIADALYGVTMSGDGMSKVISQRLNRDQRDTSATKS